MATAIPKEFLDLFDKKCIAYLATRLPDESVQVNPVWCDYENGYVTVNSAKGRVKDRNMRREPRVTLCIADPENPYRYLEVRGKVEEVTEKGAEAMIDKLAHRYLGVESYPYRRPDEVRVKYRIKPTKVFTQG